MLAIGVHRIFLEIKTRGAKLIPHPLPLTKTEKLDFIWDNSKLFHFPKLKWSLTTDSAAEIVSALSGSNNFDKRHEWYETRNVF